MLLVDGDRLGLVLGTVGENDLELGGPGDDVGVGDDVALGVENETAA